MLILGVDGWIFEGRQDRRKVLRVGRVAALRVGSGTKQEISSLLSFGETRRSSEGVRCVSSNAEFREDLEVVLGCSMFISLKS